MFFSQKQDDFFKMLSNISGNLTEGSQYFKDFKIRNESDLKEFSKVMKEYETKGDTYIHELIVALNKTFITPLEREDILELSVKMDDILDGMEACSSRFEMYNITDPNEYMVKFVEHVNQAVDEVNESVRLLGKKKLMDIRPHAIKINDYESTCDELLRVSIKDLFSKENNPLIVIQYKEMYELLEGISDSCEDVANTLETIIMRNA
ncbi:MAG TPA: DUF47 domain-containing protein [Bacillales bacterium]|nr:DUF47 domain-containing protein [Bacillales bacterium]